MPRLTHLRHYLWSSGTENGERCCLMGNWGVNRRRKIGCWGDENKRSIYLSRKTIIWKNRIEYFNWIRTNKLIWSLGSHWIEYHGALTFIIIFFTFFNFKIYVRDSDNKVEHTSVSTWMPKGCCAPWLQGLSFSLHI